MIGQKAFSLKDKQAGKTPGDVRLQEDPGRPVIKAARAEGGSKKKKITKGVSGKK